MESDYGTYIMDGLFNRAEEHGPITGSGPNFKKAMAKFKERQRQQGKIGQWGQGSNKRDNVSDGRLYDCRWRVLNPNGI